MCKLNAGRGIWQVLLTQGRYWLYPAPARLPMSPEVYPMVLPPPSPPVYQAAARL